MRARAEARGRPDPDRGFKRERLRGILDPKKNGQSSARGRQERLSLFLFLNHF